MAAMAADNGPPTPEIYFGTARAIGTPLKLPVVDPLESALNRVNYNLEPLRLSESFYRLKPVDDILERMIPASTADKANRYQHLMDSGDYLRFLTDRADAVLMETLHHLHETSRNEARQRIIDANRRGIAHLFRNLMHPAEAQRLRKLYGRQFFLISVFSAEEKRRSHLAQELADGDPQRAPDYSETVSHLMGREEGRVLSSTSYDRLLIEKRSFRLNIERTFEHGDLFVDIQEQDETQNQIRRFVELIFGHPFHTPTPDEIGMADAFSAALQSANLARQVGAAICTEEGDLLTTGTNDVPRARGGVYRSTDRPDNRDWNRTADWGYDTNDTTRRHILTDLVQHLIADPSWLSSIDSLHEELIPRQLGTNLASVLEEYRDNPRFAERQSLEALTDALVSSPVIRDSQFFGVIEYGRTMHAEMDAITSAARKGISIHGATLYCTTLPCHECARLIIGSGIRRVIFIEPYAKSRLAELYRTEVRFTSLAASRRNPSEECVDFVPYVGVSPRRFQELFSWVPRKEDDLVSPADRRLHGKAIDWEATMATSAIRETIISESSLHSRGHFNDLWEHEEELIESYRGRYEEIVKRNRRRAEDFE